ncbi:hypothetical protein Sjap_020473 [Stephania japonica]|uniref:Uncharacterized protein n=1 Tax=Stephania japonica TaxID=461633 RepID=A0AAP0F1G8_9MAGN
MHQRQSAFGRPSGTDGSDFSYRMVVENRYTKVAQGKSRLQWIIITQAVIQFAGTLFTFLLSMEEYNNLAVLSIAIGFLSLFVGELGRRCSRSSFLRLYMFASFIAILLSGVSFVQGSIFLKVSEAQGSWVRDRFQLIHLGLIVLGLLVEIKTIITTASLVHNMAPAKRAS